MMNNIKKFDNRNLTMMMDLYELTMANSLYKNPNKRDQIVLFDVFYRKNPDNGGYAIFCGLEQILNYIDNFKFSNDDINYLSSLKIFDEDFLDYLLTFEMNVKITGFKEGTIIYPNEPILTIEGPMIQCQLLETLILTYVNHQSLIATKASRIARAAQNRSVADFGARRAHGPDAAIYGARAAYIGGVNATATVLTGKMYNQIPITGTMAHSYVMQADSELDAFIEFADDYPNNCILLIDTYDTLKSGLPNAITAFRHLLDTGHQLTKYGIRIDSGDLAYLSKKCREALDLAGFNNAIIVVSNSLDEYTIKSLIEQGAQINSFGVGERLITAKSEPVFGAVYKLSGIVNSNGDIIPKIKISNNIEKITNPGRKYVFRILNKDGYAIGDLISSDKVIDISTICVNPETPWYHFTFSDVTFELLTEVLYIRNANSYYNISDGIDVNSIKDYVSDQLNNTIWEEEQRFENPHKHTLYMTLDYYNMKMSLLKN